MRPETWSIYGWFMLHNLVVTQDLDQLVHSDSPAETIMLGFIRQIVALAKLRESTATLTTAIPRSENLVRQLGRRQGDTQTAEGATKAVNKYGEIVVGDAERYEHDALMPYNYSRMFDGGYKY